MHRQHAKLSKPLTVAAALLAVSLTAPLYLLGNADAAPRATTVGSANHNGMTWVLRSQLGDVANPGVTTVGVVNVGADAFTNPYAGDTPATTLLPILCLSVNNSPRPPDSRIVIDVYNGWANGWVAATPPVQGTTLTSRDAADQRCRDYFGPAWRMAEHHDGGGNGWHLWALGWIPTNTRFWAAINDQPANPWN